mgnify:CR=1 FL=1
MWKYEKKLEYPINIKNKDYKMYAYKACPIRDCDGSWYVDIPCNLSAIEAITLPFEDA